MNRSDSGPPTSRRGSLITESRAWTPPEITPLEAYVLALLSEECSEVGQGVGKALRFGIDTPGAKDHLTGHVHMELTPRIYIAKEAGDILAALDYAAARGVLDWSIIAQSRQRKFAKLTDPDALDNLGRRLAP